MNESIEMTDSAVVAIVRLALQFSHQFAGDSVNLLHGVVDYPGTGEFGGELGAQTVPLLSLPLPIDIFLFYRFVSFLLFDHLRMNKKGSKESATHAFTSPTEA